MFVRLIETLSSVSGWWSGIGVYAMTAMIFVDVFLRYVFARPLLFADEMSVYFMVYVAFIGAALTMKMGRHIRVDILYLHLPRKVRLWLDAVTSVLGTLVTFIMTWHCAKWVIYTYRTNFISPSILETPMWIPMMVVPAGLFLWSMQYIAESVKAISLLRAGALNPAEGDSNA